MREIVKKQQVQKSYRKKDSKKEPLTEGIIIPIGPKGRRKWSAVSNDTLSRFAMRFIEERKINEKKELRKAEIEFLTR